MRGAVVTPISVALYTKLVEEKRRLQTIEDKKVKSRRIRITNIKASLSLARKL